MVNLDISIKTDVKELLTDDFLDFVYDFDDELKKKLDIPCAVKVVINDAPAIGKNVPNESSHAISKDGKVITINYFNARYFQGKTAHFIPLIPADVIIGLHNYLSRVLDIYAQKFY